MKGLVINLTRRRDRKKTIKALLKKVKLSNEFVAGVDGQKLRQREGRCYHHGKGSTRVCWTAADGTRKVKRGQRGKIFTRGLVRPWAMVGACLSHEKAIGQALQSKDRSTIIFEDDAHVAPEDLPICKHMLQAAVTAVPNFEIIQFGSHCVGMTDKEKEDCNIARWPITLRCPPQLSSTCALHALVRLLVCDVMQTRLT